MMFDLKEYDIYREKDKYIIKIFIENTLDIETEIDVTLEDSIFGLCERKTTIVFSPNVTHWVSWDLVQDNAPEETRGLQMQALWGATLKLFKNDELIKKFDLKYKFTDLKLRQGINKFSPFKKKKFWVLGDSHPGYYTNTKSIEYLKTEKYDIVPMSVMALTLYNLTNSDWKKWIENLPIFEGDVISLDFGEIDLRCGIFSASLKKSEDPYIILDNLLLQYFEFILTLKNKFDNEIIILAPNRPIKDGCLTGNVKYYKLDISNQFQRVELWNKFNEKILEFCKMNSIKYWDIKKMYTDKDGTLMNEVLYHNDIHIKIKEPMLFSLKQNIIVNL
jgi:hypothetical protein